MRRSSFIGCWLVLAACGSAAEQPSDNAGDDNVASGAGVDANSGSGTSIGGTNAGAEGSASTVGAGGKGGNAGGSGGTSNAGGAGKGGAGAMEAGAMEAGAGGAMHQASPCSKLPPAGTWENIAPAGVTWSDAIVVDPFDAATVWLGAADHGIFKSSDCGATWMHVNTGHSGTSFDKGEPISMQVDPVHQGVLYATAPNGPFGVLKSTDGGVDWNQLFPPESEVAKVVQYNLVNSIGMDAHDTNHLVVTMHADCSAPYGPVCEAETTDAGATWKITTVTGLGNSWVAGAGALILNASTWLFGTYAKGLVLTTDHGATWKDVTPSGASGSTSGKTIIMPFVPSASGNYYLAAMEGILRSSDGKAWSLIPNSGGRSVGLAMGDGHLFSSDQWSATYHTALESNLAVWSSVAPPSALPKDQGAPYLAYDAAHHLLYSSNWAGGLWRLTTP